jgi:hypothetical protein
VTYTFQVKHTHTHTHKTHTHTHTTHTHTHTHTQKTHTHTHTPTQTHTHTHTHTNTHARPPWQQEFRPLPYLHSTNRFLDLFFFFFASNRQIFSCPRSHTPSAHILTTCFREWIQPHSLTYIHNFFRFSHLQATAESFVSKIVAAGLTVPTTIANTAGKIVTICTFLFLFCSSVALMLAVLTDTQTQTIHDEHCNLQPTEHRQPHK